MQWQPLAELDNGCPKSNVNDYKSWHLLLRERLIADSQKKA